MKNKGLVALGEWPQTIKSDDITVRKRADNDGYFLGSDKERYAKVVACPYESGYKFSNKAIVMSGTTYYFRVEPIKWRILKIMESEALLICDNILANKRYHASDNKYILSDIRSWLNDEFYSKAFNSLEKKKILTTKVDNSANSTGYEPNSNECADTMDKVFLPSYKEVTHIHYCLTDSASAVLKKERKTSDYSRATGAQMSVKRANYGKGIWWLRSPFHEYCFMRNVDCDGNILYYYCVNYAIYGVVPAIKIQLS